MSFVLIEAAVFIERSSERFSVKREKEGRESLLPRDHLYSVRGVTGSARTTAS